MFTKTTYFIDTTKGPKIYNRYSLNFKPLLGILFAILLIASIAILVVAAPNNPQEVAPESPKITVHCTNANCLVFQDLSGNYLAYVSFANSKQFEEIMALNITPDESINDFRLCITEPKHYEIRLNDELVFVHADGVPSPSQYNYTLSDQELSDMLNSSSDEVKYLYEEFNKIFKIS